MKVEEAGGRPSLAYAYRVLLDRDDFDADRIPSTPDDDVTWSHAESAFQEGGCQPIGTGGANSGVARGANPEVARGANPYVGTNNDPLLTPPIKRDEMVPRATASAFTPASRALAAAFLQAIGIQTLLEIPPELAGLEYRAVLWLQQGWPPDMIAAEASRFAGERPIKPFSYFEKVFATAYARRQAPLPIAEARSAETRVVTSNDRLRSGNLIQAADRLVDRLRSFDARPSGGDGVRSRTGAAAPRLLSKG
ncbi:hypothetical protein [Bradyrhizobium sp. CCBAU 11357]|uniref:hypothetical protein n=1 Tax=Bradyrhizobium sp. CCBAU 11357 TaxID=1630808 RepID=UPI003FA4188E